eukprot:1077959_1
MVLLFFVIIITISNANQCIRSHSDYTIDYISNNANTDSSIRYLGTQSSTIDCQNSCRDLNYLCDTSSSNVFVNDFKPQFNNESCSITYAWPSYDSTSTVFLTSDLIAKEYILDASLTVTAGREAGVLWKSNFKENDDYLDYYFGFDVADNIVVSAQTKGHSNPTWVVLDSASVSLEHNTRYNLTVHVKNTAFTTYLNGEEYYDASSDNHAIDKAIFTGSCAGMYCYRSDVVFHSFTMRFPDATDNQDELSCAAYMYDKVDGHCYGYYGDNYALIETSLSKDTEYKHDSAVLYNRVTCAPTIAPTTPSRTPTLPPSLKPSLLPTSLPTLPPSGTPSRSHILTSDPSLNPTFQPTLKPTPGPTVHPTLNPSLEWKEREVERNTMPTASESEEKDSKGSQASSIWNNDLFIVAFVFVGIALCACTVISIYCFLLHKTRKQSKQSKDIDAMKMIQADTANVIQPTSGCGTEPMDIVNASGETVAPMGENQEPVGNECALELDSVDPITEGNEVADFEIADDEFIVMGDDETHQTPACSQNIKGLTFSGESYTVSILGTHA